MPSDRLGGIGTARQRLGLILSSQSPRQAGADLRDKLENQNHEIHRISTFAPCRESGN